MTVPTQRKNLEVRLQENEARLRAIIDHEPECVKVVAPDGTVLEMNPAGLRLLEADSLAQVQHRSVFPLIAEEHRAAFRALHDRVLRGESGLLEFAIIGLKGTRRTLDTQAVPLRDAAGTITGVLGLTRDITARKQAELALAESEARFRGLTEHSLNGIYIIQDGRLTYVNPAMARILGYAPQELIGREALVVVHPDDHALVTENMRRRITGEAETLQYSFRGLRKDGKILEIEVLGGRMELHGRPAIFGSFLDITARKQTDAALAESRQHLATLIQSVDGIVWEADARTFAFTFVSQRAERLLGYPCQRWLEEATFWSEHIHPEDRERAVQFCTASTAGKRDHEFEYRMLAADGRVVWLHDIVKVVVENDQPIKLRGVMVDITARKQAEKVRQESEERFRTIFEQAPLGVALIDSLTGRIYEANHQYAEIAGRTREELAQIDWMRITHPDDLSEDLANMAQLNAGKVTGFQMNKRLIRPDGSGVWISLTVATIKVPNPAHPLHLAMIRDITVQREVEAHTRELAGYLDKAHDAIIVVNLDNRITFWNEAATRLSGLTATEALGRTPGELAGSLPLAQLNAMRQAVLQTGAWQGDIQLRNKQDHLFDLNLSTTLIRDEAGRPKARLNIFTDISERKKTEAHSREQVALLNQTRDLIIVTDLNGCVTFWNEGAERLSGWLRTEIVGQPVAALLVPGQAERSASIRQIVNETGNWQGEVRIQSKSGAAFDLDLRVTLLRDVDGNPTGRLNVGTDITEKKKLEEQFFRVQRIESIGMLASGIAHDLNNVLTPILMTAPMLRRNATDPLDLRLLETLEHSAERGASLVRQILSFAHGTAGEPRLLQIKHIARDLIEVIEETFPKSLQLEHDFPNEIWPISANPTQIHQVLLNLCVNARDAMPKGGTLSLSTANRRLDEAQAAAIPGARPGAFVLLEVRDTGTGIPPEALAHIWEPFFTTKGEAKGTGLGLSTVRGIVENHRGFIALQTAAGTGTTFQVYLPAAETEDATVASVHPFLPRGNGELILLVDDEVNNRDVTHATLARYGYRVLVAGNGTEAIALFVPRREEIRLVITDLNMPNLDGSALARILLRLKPDLRILAISGLVPKPVDIPADFLAKPFKTEVLLFKVHAMLHLSPPPMAGA